MNAEELIERLMAHDEDAATQIAADFEFLWDQPHSLANNRAIEQLTHTAEDILAAYEDVGEEA